MLKYDELINIAREALGFSYSPYSRFRVAAALLCKDGSIYTGCNIENSSYPAGVCAETVAFCKAVSDGRREFTAICVVSSKSGQPCPPCGICRQVMSEFCTDEFEIVLTDGDEIRVHTLSELLPERFGGKHLCE